MKYREGVNKGDKAFYVCPSTLSSKKDKHKQKEGKNPMKSKYNQIKYFSLKSVRSVKVRYKPMHISLPFLFWTPNVY